MSARLLNHSLERNPKDVVITEKDIEIINKIKENENFNKKINEIIKKYENEEKFDTGIKKDSLAFEDGDLEASIHNSYIQVMGTKRELKIILSDVYDFTDFKEIKEYWDKDDIVRALALGTGNNLAMIATSCDVVHKYNVTIKFSIQR